MAVGTAVLALFWCQIIESRTKSYGVDAAVLLEVGGADALPGAEFHGGEGALALRNLGRQISCPSGAWREFIA